MAHRPRVGRRRPRGTVHAAPAIVEKLLLRRLGFRPNWVSLRSGELEPLVTEIDTLIGNPGVEVERIEQHLLDAAHRNGVQPDVVRRLLSKRLVLFRKHRLAIQARKLRLAAEAAMGSARTQLRGLARRNHSTALASIQRRRSHLKGLELRMAVAWRSMPDKVVARLRAATPRVCFGCELDAADQRLVSDWRRDPKRKLDEETSRLESARRAEKASLAYYSSLGYQVEDVSIQQLREGALEHWKTHDIRADDQPLDVKNVRCPRPDRFGEYHWKEHKQHGTREVSIVGVVSMEDGDPGVSTITGELEHSDLAFFRDQVSSYPRDQKISAEFGDWSTFVPGWLFEYPKRHYASMPDWDDVLRRWLKICDGLNVEVAPWILALAASRMRSLPSRPLDTRVTGSARRFFRHFGVSRRTLFWFALTYLLSHMEEPRARNDLIEQIFPDRATATRSADRSSKEEEFPLALFDPRTYIWHLIHTLSQMIQSNRRLLATVSEYRLRGAGVLQALVEGRWRTVLAYCGNCGKWPIFLREVSEGDCERTVEDGACRSCPCERVRLVCDGCRACAGFDCTGKEYATAAEALRAAQELPGWRKIGNRLLPPDPDGLPLVHPEIR